MLGVGVYYTLMAQIPGRILKKYGSDKKPPGIG